MLGRELWRLCTMIYRVAVITWLAFPLGAAHREPEEDWTRAAIRGHHHWVRCVLTADHEAPARSPLVIEPGDVVEVGERDTEWPAFVFVTHPNGSGWVPGRFLETSGTVGTVVTGYDTTELSLRSGEIVEVVRDDLESGWSWCRTDNGREGWIPHRVLAAA